jgi:hypothetical protein
MVMVAGTDVGVMRVTSTDTTGHFTLDGCQQAGCS